MDTALSREEYVDLVLFGHPAEYPKSTDQAVQELRERGYDATEPPLNYYVKTSRVTPGKKGGRNLKWDPEHIDGEGQFIGEDESSQFGMVADARCSSPFT